MKRTPPLGNRLVPITLLLAGLAGCQATADGPATTGSQSPSTVPTPIGSREARSDSHLEPQHEPDSPWTLTQVLDRISRHNPDLVRARAGLQQAQAGLEMNQASYWPEFAFGLQYGSTDNPGQAFGTLMNQQRVNLGPGFDPTPGNTENWRKELRVDWSLWNPERAAQKRAAEAGERGAQDQVQFVEQELRNAGVQAWFGLQAVRALKEVQDESILVVEERLRQTQKRMELGAAIKADVLRLQVRLAQAQQSAAQAELQVQMATSALNRLMARGPQERLVLQVDPEQDSLNLSPASQDFDDWIAMALVQRRDLHAAQQEVQRLEHESTASDRSGGARVTAFGAYDVDGHDLNLDTDLDSYTLGIGLSVPLSKRTSARRATSRAQLMGARAQLQSLSLQIQGQVSNAGEVLRVARVQLQLATSAVSTAEEAYRILAAAQDAGGATVTDVLEAEDARRRARVARVAAEFNVQISQAQLAKAVGLFR